MNSVRRLNGEVGQCLIQANNSVRRVWARESIWRGLALSVRIAVKVFHLSFRQSLARVTIAQLGMVALVLLGCSASYESVEFPKGWSVKKFPVDGSTDWYMANRSDGWSIRNTDHGIVASSPSLYSTATSYSVKGGTLIGINRGEWGGSLRWIPGKDTGAAVAILPLNVKGIFEWDGSIHLLTGLDHLGLSSGDLYRLDYAESTWLPMRIIDLREAPYAYTTTIDGQLYVVTSSKIFRIYNAHVDEIVPKNTNWNGLYPTSVIIRDNHALIGMRGGILEVDLDTRNSTWYVR